MDTGKFFHISTGGIIVNKMGYNAGAPYFRKEYLFIAAAKVIWLFVV
jgi:hypothetical protein